MDGDTMSELKIVMYFKPMCGWSGGVHAVLEKYGLKYERKNIIKDQAAYTEMVSKTQQTLAPCVEINGEMLTDVGGEEVEAYLLEKKLVIPSDDSILSSIDHQGCGSS
jgi:glutaredoxin